MVVVTGGWRDLDPDPGERSPPEGVTHSKLYWFEQVCMRGKSLTAKSIVQRLGHGDNNLEEEKGMETPRRKGGQRKALNC